MSEEQKSGWSCKRSEERRSGIYSAIGVVAGAMVILGGVCLAGAFMIFGAATLKKVGIWAGIW